MLERVLDSEKGAFRFVNRNVPVPGDLRPTWRVALSLLIVAKAGYRGTMSLNRLHVLSWAALSKDLRELFLQVLSGKLSKSQFPVRFDPAQNRAINFARGEGLLEIVKKKHGLQLKITDRGRDFAAIIEKDPFVFRDEKIFLDAIGQQVTESFVRDLIRWRDR